MFKTHLEFDTFEQAYIGNICSITIEPEFEINSRIGDCWERTRHSYEVRNIQSYKFNDESLGKLDYGYIEAFYDWVISGSVDTEEAFKEYPNVAKFLEKPKNSELPKNFNTFYGPRMVSQRPSIVNELKQNPNSRRAVISILKDSDLSLLGTDETLEFPCTDSATFFIREGKLNCHVHMRSQNMVTVVKLDMYLWARFTCEMAEDLGIEPGRFSSTIVSAHVFERDQKYLQSLKILD